jgi:hypothetical protein
MEFIVRRIIIIITPEYTVEETLSALRNSGVINDSFAPVIGYFDDNEFECLPDSIDHSFTTITTDTNFSDSELVEMGRKVTEQGDFIDNIQEDETNKEIYKNPNW